MKLPIIACARLSSAAFLFVLAFAYPASAQNGTQPTPPAATPPPAAAPDTQATPSTDDDNAPPSAPVNRSQRTVAQNTDEAWSILKLAAADPKKPDNRALAVTAIGTIQNSRIAHKLISDALVDSSIDVRIAGILAVGTTKDKGLYGNLRQMLDDKEPAIAFTAALTLWKTGDRSGEDILIAVIEGDRKTSANLFKTTERSADKDLHSPARMADLAARQGIPMIFGPAGYGFTAWDFTHQHNGENPRVTSLGLLSQEKTPNVHNTLLSALDDKDPQVRAASARALGEYRDKGTATNLLTTFGDGKLPVRLLGAAAYIRVTSGTSEHHIIPKI